MVVGNYRGGIAIYETDNKTSSVANNDVDNPEFEYTLSPNPSSQQVEIFIKDINNDNIQVNIFDITGKNLATWRGTNKIDIQSLSQGIYIFEMIFDEGRIVEKVIKK